MPLDSPSLVSENEEFLPTIVPEERASIEVPRLESATTRSSGIEYQPANGQTPVSDLGHEHVNYHVQSRHVQGTSITDDNASTQSPQRLSIEEAQLSTPLASHESTCNRRHTDTLAPTTLVSGRPWGDGNIHSRGKDTPWRHPYLRRRILLLFLVSFILLASTVETLLAVSNKNRGLATSQQRWHYTWTYIPTALLTLVTGFWGRVEYQAKASDNSVSLFSDSPPPLQHANDRWFRSGSPIMQAGAPWWRLSKHPNNGAKQTILLDYVSMIPPIPILAALKNRDWMVALVSTISIALRAMTAVSTGLIKLTPTDIVSSTAQITLNDAFITSATEATGSQTLAWGVLAGVASRNMSYPAGISHGFSYQNYSVEQADVFSVTATVEGFHASLDCFSFTLDDVRWAGSPQSNTTLQNLSVSEMTLTVENDEMDCPLSIELSNPPLDPDGPVGCLILDPICDNLTETMYVGTFQQTACGVGQHLPLVGLSNSNVVALFYAITPISNSWRTALTDLTGVICKPFYVIERVDVTASPTGVQNVSISDDASPRTIDGVEGSDIYSLHWASETDWNMNQDGALLRVDAGFETALGLAYEKPFPSASHLLYAPNLQNLAENFFTQFGAVLAHSAFMKDSHVAGIATVTASQQRLIVSSIATHLVTGLLAACILMCLGAVLLMPKTGFMPMTNGSIIRSAALISQSEEIISSLRGTGAAALRTLEERLSARYSLESSVINKPSASESSKNTFRVRINIQDQTESKVKPRRPTTQAMIQKPKHPIILHPVSRTITNMTILGLIITLEITLGASSRHQGIADVKNEDQTHLIWTVIPAVILSILATVLPSADFGIRTLAPFSVLRNGAKFNALRLNLLDRLIWGVLYEEIRAGLLTATAATLSSLIAAFFTIASAALFVAQDMPFESSTYLSAVSSFNRSGLLANDQWPDPLHTQTPLVLLGDLPFPPFVYRDLVFPELQRPSSTAQSSNISGTFPALRPRMECELFDPSRINVNITSDNYFGDIILTASVDDEQCHGGYPSPESFVGSNESAPDENNVTVTVSLLGGPDLDDAFLYSKIYRAYADLANQNVNGDTNDSCRSSWFYVWGKKEGKGTTPETLANMPNSLSILKCSESMEIVDTNVEFVGPDLAIDDNLHPPEPMESTVRPLHAPTESSRLGDGIGLYASLGFPAATATGLTRLDPLFDIITSSIFAVPQDILGNRENASLVADAIALHHKIMRAIDISMFRRIPAELSDVLRLAAVDAGVDLNSTAAPSTDARDYNATLLTKRRRVVQGGVSTRVLQALLGLTVVLSLVAWVLMPNTKLFPRDVTSIASLAALLADGDFVRRLPADSAWMTDQELEAWLKADMGFWMGWKDEPLGTRVGWDESSRLAERTEEAGSKKFSIWIKEY